MKKNSFYFYFGIIFSGLLVATFIIHFRPLEKKPKMNTTYVKLIAQTGLEKEPLTTDCLSELLELSSDQPLTLSQINPHAAKAKLLSSPLIKTAHVNRSPPSTLYIDYSVRTPSFFLADYENIVMDKKGFLFPLFPFFTPKKLPEIYLGLGPFNQECLDKPLAKWNEPLKGKYIDLAFNIIAFIENWTEDDSIRLKRLDVSNAFNPSLGEREIVLIFEYIPATFHHLRLTPKNYQTELIHYKALKNKFTKQENFIIDLRVPNLGFMERGMGE